MNSGVRRLLHQRSSWRSECTLFTSGSEITVLQQLCAFASPPFLILPRMGKTSSESVLQQTGKHFPSSVWQQAKENSLTACCTELHGRWVITRTMCGTKDCRLGPPSSQTRLHQALIDAVILILSILTCLKVRGGSLVERGHFHRAFS